MKPLPLDPELLAVARRVVWFEPPEKALANTARFLAYFMTYGTAEDIAVMRAYVTPDDLRDALDRAPPGIIDARSWAYWNVMVDRYPPPPMPVRVFPDR